MATNKTVETNSSVPEFIDAVEKPQQRADSYRLIAILGEITGKEPKLWGPSIIGFGSYHYKYASGHEGTAPLLGFSPRKGATSLYIYAGGAESDALLPLLGKYKMGKACIYINKLSDIDEQVLRQIAKNSIAMLDKTYTINK
jgi:hypothetical protein